MKIYHQQPEPAIANAIDDAKETIRGRTHHDKAHGDETTNSLHDHWHMLQAFAGVGQ